MSAFLSVFICREQVLAMTSFIYRLRSVLNDVRSIVDELPDAEELPTSHRRNVLVTHDHHLLGTRDITRFKTGSINIH